MSTTITEPKPAAFVLHGVTWQTYERLLNELGEQHVRLTYDRGTLEFMSPQRKHEYYSRVLSRWIDVVGEELGMSVALGGSTTFRREELDRGLEPDSCFWIANEKAVRDRMEIDLAVDPPPDLAIEIDITHSSLDRLAIYAALRVPEVWRYDGRELRVLILEKGKYKQSRKSASFPTLPMKELQAFLHKPAGMSEHRWVQSFRLWVQARVKT